MMNSTTYAELPPLPAYTLKPLPPLVHPIPDKYLSMILLIVAYWVVSLFFHWIDVNDYFPQYRLHTPAELLGRNHVSRWEVFRDVVVQQIIQTGFGVFLGYWFEPDPFYGKEDYDVAVWAQRIRIAQRVIPLTFGILGLDSRGLAIQLSSSHPSVAGVLNGGDYPWLAQVNTVSGTTFVTPSFAPWELETAKVLYWFIIPAFQFGSAILLVDTWQYFWHRAMHINKWLYNNVHSRHHRLYVPYAYGALYNHPVEGFLLDTLGAGIAYLLTGMTTRQAMCFYTCCTIKTVDDHCGYSLPWDPIQRLTSNNAGYHDVHHQSWGIKTNFSQPFFTFWDSFMGTKWTGGDVSARYERSRIAAQKKQDSLKREVSSGVKASQVTEAAKRSEPSQKVFLEDSTGSKRTYYAKDVSEEKSEEKEARRTLKRGPRKGSISQSGGLKGLHDRVYGSLHGRGSGVLGLESNH